VSYCGQRVTRCGEGERQGGSDTERERTEHRESGVQHRRGRGEAEIEKRRIYGEIHPYFESQLSIHCMKASKVKHKRSLLLYASDLCDRSLHLVNNSNSAILYTLLTDNICRDSELISPQNAIPIPIDLNFRYISRVVAFVSSILYLSPEKTQKKQIHKISIEVYLIFTPHYSLYKHNIQYNKLYKREKIDSKY
jgi:hypothetical protein